MKLTTLLSAVLVASSLMACSGAASDADGQDVTADELTGTATNRAVTWHYTDAIGRGLEADQQVPGHVTVKFTGPALPLSTGKSTLQAANVVLELPAFDDPNTLVKRTFLVHFETFDGGSSYRSDSVWGAQGSVIDASLPNATTLFSSTYNTATQTTRPRTEYATPVRRVDFALTKQSTGDFKLVATVAGYEEREFARHSTTITLQ